MHEKLVEHWLTEVNELGYQLPFAEALLYHGYTVLHVSTHGRGEHGKDIVARRSDGLLCTFQLKGGDINLSGWRAIRGEVEELVQLPVRVPGVSEGERHLPHLVTNGQIRGDALESIQRFSDTWVESGHPRMEVWQRGTVLKLLVDAKEHFLPDSLLGFRQFVELFVANFRERFPVADYSLWLQPALGTEFRTLRGLQQARLLAALALTGSYIVEQYERAENHLSAVEGWSTTACAVLCAAERYALAGNAYKPTLDLLRIGYLRALDRFAEEALASGNLASGLGGIVDPYVYGARVTLVMGWLSIWGLSESSVAAGASGRIHDVMRREVPGFRVQSEADWPSILANVLFLERVDLSSDAEALLRLWIAHILERALDDTANGFPSPYWSQEKVLRMMAGMLPPYESESFGKRSFTISQALDCLVRRANRKVIAEMWPSASKLEFADCVPDQLGDYFLWRAEEAATHLTINKGEASWTEWRIRSAAVQQGAIPQVLLKHPEWILPFTMCFPHRANKAMSALADAVIGTHGTLSPLVS